MKVVHSQQPEKSKFNPEKDYCEGCEGEILETEMDDAIFDDDGCWTCAKCMAKYQADAKRLGLTMEEYFRTDEEE